MNRIRLGIAALLSVTTLVTVGTTTAANAATPTATYTGVYPGDPMPGERFNAGWKLSTTFVRETRLQTRSGDSWKTIATGLANGGGFTTFFLHSTKTRDYRVYVPKAVRSGRTYTSFSSSPKTLRVFGQTATGYAVPYASCPSFNEDDPTITFAVQFLPNRAGRNVTFRQRQEGTHPVHAVAEGVTDTKGRVIVTVSVADTSFGDKQTVARAEGYNGSAAKSVAIAYRNLEGLCNY